VAEVYIPNNGKIDDVEVSSAARVIVEPLLNCAELDLSASSSSVIEVKTIAQEVSIDASGASTIKAELNGAKLDLDLSGASVARLSGKVVKGEVDLSGASTLHAETLHASTLEVECSGASKANVVAHRCVAEASGASSIVAECSQQLDISVSGASSVIYSGDCQTNVISNTGASTIRKR
jgi:riboflavin synthase alpha subunit